MSYTRRNYEEIANVLAKQIKLIKEDSNHMDESEVAAAKETVFLVCQDLMDMFEKNWSGFDRKRFFKDSGLKNLSL